MGTRRGRGRLIVRPWLADPGGGGSEKEVALPEPWLQDPPHSRKVFTLAGFVPSARLTVDQVRDVKEELRAIILKLGGELVESDEWDERVSHVIAHVEGAKESMSEKVMAGLAGGRWVLTRRYLDKCSARGSWLSSPAVFTINEAVSRHRRAWHQHGRSGSVFHGMKAALLISDLRRAGVYKRIFLSGGGNIYKCYSVSQLVNKRPTQQELTHVFLDPWILLPSDPRHADFLKLREYIQTQGLDIKLLSYKYLFMKIRQHPQPSESEYSIFNQKIQEMGMKEFATQRDRMKRPLESPSNKQTAAAANFKKKRSEIVTLDSSDSDEETRNPQIHPVSLSGLAGTNLEISRVTDTSYVSQIENILDEKSFTECPKMTTAIQDYDIPEVFVSDSSIANNSARDSTIELDDDIDSSDDDDILVLEQKLALSWQQVGGSPRYVEREKAGRRNQVVGCEKRRSVYIPSQQDEYLKQSKLQPDEAVEAVETVTLDSEEEGDPDICDIKKTVWLSKRFVKTPVSDLESGGSENAPNIVILESEDDDDIVEVSSSVHPGENAGRKDSVERRVVGVVRSQREEFLLAAAQEERLRKVLVEVEAEAEAKIKESPPRPPKVTEETPENSPKYQEFLSTTDVNPDEMKETERPVVSPSLPISVSQSTVGLGIERTQVDFSEDVIEFEDIEFVDQPKELAVDLFDDDESDFEINTSNEEASVSRSPEQEFSSSDVREYAIAAVRNYPTIKVNIRRMNNRDYLIHRKIMTDYMSMRQNVSAPEFRDLDDSFSSRQKILINPITSPQKQSTSLLHRIVATLYKRFAMTGELEAVGWTLPHTPLQYDTNKESPARSTSVVSFMKQTLLIDFLQLIQEESRIKNDDLFEKDEGSEEEEENGNIGPAELNDFDRFKTLDYVTFLKRLKMETNYYRFPTSKVRICQLHYIKFFSMTFYCQMLNTVWTKCLMSNSCHHVMLAAVDYLHHLLFFLTGQTRNTWLTMALSAFRDLKDHKLFNTFDSANPQELLLCFEFWKDICGRVMQNSEYSCDLGEDNSDNSWDYLGPYLIFKFLVKMMKKDLEIWGERAARTNLTCDGKFNYPAVFYILGGTDKHLVKNFSKTVLSLYRQFLRTHHELTEVRKLVSIFAVFLSHLDLQEDYGSLYGGYKRSLAKQLCDLYLETSLPATSLYTELSLLTPAWLSALVSQRLMTRCNRQYDKLADVSQLKTKLLSLSRCQDLTLLMTLDNFTHKLLGKDFFLLLSDWFKFLFLGYQQVHSIFRAYWHYFKNVNSDFITFNQLSQLEETGPREKIVQFGRILFHLTSLTESVALLTEFANSRLSFHSSKNSTEGLDEIGALRALFFTMNCCNDF